MTVIDHDKIIAGAVVFEKWDVLCHELNL